MYLKHKNLLTYFISFLLFSFISCSSSQTNQNSNNLNNESIGTTGQSPLMVLPAPLQAVSPNLSSTLTVYSTSVTQIFHKSLSFVDDSAGNTIVTSPPLTLTQNNHYRFVVVFYWNDEVFAHIDSVFQVSGAETTNLTYADDDIEYEATDPNSNSTVPLLSEETEALQISSLTINRDANDNLTLDAIITGTFLNDANATLTLLNLAGDSVFLALDLSDQLISAGGQLTLSTTIQSEDISENDFKFRFVVTDSNDNESRFTTNIISGS